MPRPASFAFPPHCHPDRSAGAFQPARSGGIAAQSQFGCPRFDFLPGSWVPIFYFLFSFITSLRPLRLLCSLCGNPLTFSFLLASSFLLSSCSHPAPSDPSTVVFVIESNPTSPPPGTRPLPSPTSSISAKASSSTMAAPSPPPTSNPPSTLCATPPIVPPSAAPSA